MSLMISPVKVFNTYKNNMIGKRVDIDGQFGYQCVDLMRDYALNIGMPPIEVHGSAIDLWNTGLGNKYTRVYNSILQHPPYGAIVFYNYGQYGHVGISGYSNLLYIELLEQNGGAGIGDGIGTDAIRLKKRSYSQCLGWFITN